MSAYYLNDPAKPEGCPLYGVDHVFEKPATPCNVRGPFGLNSAGILWRCTVHELLFVADYHSGALRASRSRRS